VEKQMFGNFVQVEELVQAMDPISLDDRRTPTGHLKVGFKEAPTFVLELEYCPIPVGFQTDRKLSKVAFNFVEVQVFNIFVL
jgi:hypothetical protein